MWKKFFFIFIFFFSIVRLIIPILKNWDLFTEKFYPKFYEKKYNSSQYVVPNSKNPISDEDIYAYAGYRYITGLNPILINSDHPPLGKYLIGFFILLTGNHRFVSIFFALANIIVFTLIIYFLTKSIEMIILSLFFISLDSMFLDQIIHSPILDIIQLFFLLFYFFTFLMWLKYKKIFWIVLCGIVLGFFSSVKMYFPSLILMSTLVAYFFLSKNFSLKKIILFFSINFIFSFLIYTLTYLKYFLEGNSLRSFLGVQKWIFLYWHENSVRGNIFFGSVFPFILFNQWKIWWGNRRFINYENWNFFWPIFFSLGIISTLLIIYKYLKIYFRKKISKKSINFEFFLSLWILFYLSYLLFIPISPRYLLMLFFPIYLLIILLVSNFTKKYQWLIKLKK